MTLERLMELLHELEAVASECYWTGKLDITILSSGMGYIAGRAQNNPDTPVALAAWNYPEHAEQQILDAIANARESLQERER